MPKGIYTRQPRPSKSYPHELVTNVRILYAQGKTMVEISESLNIGVHVLQRLTPRHGIHSRKAIPRNQTGTNNKNWKGAAAGYAAFHYRLKVQYGKPEKCEECGSTDKRRSFDWANLTGRYDDPKDYKRLCRSCHWKLDKKHLNFTKGGGVSHA